jgi:hypothetical protein
MRREAERHRRTRIPGAVLLLILAVLISVNIAPALAPYSGPSSNCMVTDKDRVAKSKGGSDMRVYTSCGVFAVSDSWLQGRWDSADTYAGIQVGQVYDFEAVGWRLPLFSAFPNILTATPAG